MVILEKRLEHLKKHYYLTRYHSFPSHTPPSDIEKTLIHVYHDRQYADSRQVFSQDRRPSKRVTKRPAILIMASDPEDGLICQLRTQKIPAEAVLLSGSEGWHKEEGEAIGLGNQYHVPESELKRSLEQVEKEKRLYIEGERSRDLNFLYALMMPVWFAETVRKIRRYGGG